MPEEPPSGNTSKTRTSLDQLFTALSHEPRRRVLCELADRPRPDESGDDPRRLVVEDTDFARLEQELYHCHLPKLDDAEFVDWVPESGSVSPGPRFEDIEPLLSLLDDHREELPESWP